MATIWLDDLDDDDRAFLKRFLLASGSLKDLAAEYGVSYPTIRSRLDRLIAKVTAGDSAAGGDPFDRALRVLVADLAIAPAAAKKLLAAHKQTLSPRSAS